MGEPLYASERNFRRYEPVIQQIIQAYPKAFVFRPKGLSTDTVCARLRDAVKHQLKNNWTTYLDMAQLSQVADSVIFRHDGVKVTICTKSKESLEMEFEAELVSNLPTISNPTLEEILAFGLLITNRRLKLQVIFQDVLPLISSSAREHFESNPLVEFFQEKPNSNEWILL